MFELIIPKWKDFRSLIHNSKSSLIVCSPYYSETGINIIFDNIRKGTDLSFFTKISPSDWVNGVSDPVSLLSLIEVLESGGYSVNLNINQRLHAKIYLADQDVALVGSSNMSEGGFSKNLELMIKMDGNDALSAVEIFDQNIRSECRKFDTTYLKEWVNKYSQLIKNFHNSKETEEASELEDAQHELDKLLGFGRASRTIINPSISDLHYFTSWLEKNLSFSGAETLNDRYYNLDKQNLTGHFRQCFFSVFRFLKENPEIQHILANECDRLSSKTIYKPSQYVLSSWINHIDTHATDKSSDYSYSILRGILPPSLGGTRMGGGGGSSTLKRMLPLVGKYIEENKNEI